MLVLVTKVPQWKHFTTFPMPLLGLIGKGARLGGITGGSALGKIFDAATETNFEGALTLTDDP